MITLAKLVFDLVLPTEDAGGHAMSRVEKDAALVRRLFEKAVGNFYRAELAGAGWRVQQGKTLDWQIEFLTHGAKALFPGMVSDIILENESLARRLVIDTKFTSVFGRSQHREAILKSGYIYQLYTYLRSQERADDPLSLDAGGVFLHPTVEGDLDETVRIQGHEIRFVTIDLMLPTAVILARLRSLVQSPRIL
jgi:5-methylcytosine-specific restriction enzyme subunit McrC